MADTYLIKNKTLTDIADAIRLKKRTSDLVKVSNMASEIQGLRVDKEMNMPMLYISNGGSPEGTYRPGPGEDGFSVVSIEGSADLVPDNIKKGACIYGVYGTFEGGGGGGMIVGDIEFVGSIMDVSAIIAGEVQVES